MCLDHFKRPQTKFFKYYQGSLTKNSQNELDKISISILDIINTSLQKLITVNYWKDTSEVIECFKNIGNKQTHEFITFDIKDFNPAIMKDLKMVKVS